MSIFRISGKLHEADTDSLKLKIPRAKEFDKESSVTKNILKGKNRNITYEHEQASTVSKSLPSLSSELKTFAIWGYNCGNGGTGHHHEALPVHLEDKNLYTGFILVTRLKPTV